MRRGARLGRLAAVITPMVLLAAAAAFFSYKLERSPHRTDLSAYWVVPISLISIYLGLIGAAWRLYSSWQGGTAGPAELDELAGLLAEAVEAYCSSAVRELRLAEPIPVRWKRSSRPLAGPVSAAAGSQAFSPVPKLAAVGEQQLNSGQIDNLFQVFGGLGSGRLVIVGTGGSGKSGAGVILVRDLLKHRKQVPEPDRPQVPVPVMLTLAGWDPAQDIVTWLSARLTEVYPFPFHGARRGAAAAARLLRTDRVAVILDGFDALPARLRQDSVRALNRQAAFRLVVLSRPDEMAEAARQDPLAGAVALELQDVDPYAAADYLASVRADPPPDGWAELIGRLRTEPASPLATALHNPEALNLVRDTCGSLDEIRRFLRFCETRGLGISQADTGIEDYLLDCVLGTVDKLWPPESGEAALRTLNCIAARMNQDGTHDLEWWHIPEWTPRIPRILATAAAAGLAASAVSGIALGLGAGLRYGFAFGCLLGLVAGLRKRLPRRMTPLRWSSVFSRASLAPAGPFGCVGGLATGLLLGAVLFSVFVIEFQADYLQAFVFGLGIGFLLGFVVWSAVGLLYGLVRGLVSGLSQSGPDAASPLSPPSSWRRDLAASLVTGIVGGLGFGLVSGIAAGLARGFSSELMSGFMPSFVHMLITALVFGLAGGLAYGLVSSRAWAASIAAVQLARRCRSLRFFRLIRFLETASNCQVLRTVGPTYQFRNSRMQDRLACLKAAHAHSYPGRRTVNTKSRRPARSRPSRH
jgi:hypothetical protein